MTTRYERERPGTGGARAAVNHHINTRPNALHRFQYQQGVAFVRYHIWRKLHVARRDLGDGGSDWRKSLWAADYSPATLRLAMNRAKQVRLLITRRDR